MGRCVINFGDALLVVFIFRVDSVIDLAGHDEEISIFRKSENSSSFMIRKLFSILISLLTKDLLIKDIY